jgi:magnesium transporter
MVIPLPGNLERAVAALNDRYLREHAGDAARTIERLDVDDAARELSSIAPVTLARAWSKINPAIAAAVMREMPDEQSAALLAEITPIDAVPILSQMDEERRETLLGLLAKPLREELDELLGYPQDSAGRIMDTRVATFRADTTAGTALEQLRKGSGRATADLFLIDDRNALAGFVPIQDVATAEHAVSLGSLARPVGISVTPLTPREEISEIVERHRVSDLPVVDMHDRLLGVIPDTRLMQAMQESMAADMQRMTGASAEERALSPAMFAVKKRLPWLHINLVTAFMAAAVVGIFEGTIARFTALAVLLPVVAGQSGNSGAQALAVTMRGLVLREISPRQWPRVVTKEAIAGLLNGIAIAITCGLGVYVWSRSAGLVLVIMVSMALAMTIAGIAGALVPITLRRLGMDPAQSSSIVLTTVTDIAGFLGFLGIATMLSGML